MAQFSKGQQPGRRRGKGQGSTGRRKKLESAVWWVMDNTLDAKPPSELHRKLQAAYKADDTAFIRDVVKQITASKETETATTTADQDEADYRKILEDMLAEMEGRTGQPNDGTVKAPGDGLPHRPQGTDR
jgi:hypothetical protein